MCTDFEKAKTSIVEGIDGCFNTWCTNIQDIFIGVEDQGNQTN